jgi:PAS domain S-box-containing protein
MNRSLPHRLEPAHAGALLERLLAIADDAVIVADDEQRIVVFNEGAERAFGHCAADILGRPLSLLLPEAAHAAHAEHMRRFAHSPQAARRMAERRDIGGVRVDGSLFDAEASISHVELGGRTYYAAILRDVSAARHDARVLRRSELRFRQLAASAPVGIFQRWRA